MTDPLKRLLIWTVSIDILYNIENQFRSKTAIVSNTRVSRHENEIN